MTTYKRFKFQTMDDLRAKIDELNLCFNPEENTGVLAENIKINNFILPNRIAIQPMEGCDGLKDGSPSPLTLRRYKRFGGSGAGLCWFEATAVKQDARANSRQLMLSEQNKNAFRKIIDVYEESEANLIDSNQISAFGKSLKILQITHSGRYSAPGYKNPQRMYWYNVLDKAFGISRRDGKILSDEELESLKDYFEKTTELAKEIGFDGVDLKSCHRYLLSESLSAFTRENSKYGGESYENRTRLLKSIIKKLIAKYSTNSFIVTLRINIFDGLPYPYGWGVKKEKEEKSNSENYTNRSRVPIPDLSEPIHLLNELYGMGIRLANLTLANPYFNPFISRPYESPTKGSTFPSEHPLMGVNRFISLTGKVKSKIPPNLAIVGTGYSWLRQFGGNIAADQVIKGNVDIVGWGRMAFANPEFPKQILLDGSINKKKTCITCSKCTELMRMNSVSGCPIKDKDIYMSYYKGKNILE